MKRELKILGEELLDVRAFDIVRLLELDDFENLLSRACQYADYVCSFD